MNRQDIIMSALTLGTPCNPQGKVFRSAKALRAYAGIDHAELMEILLGDLAPLIITKPGENDLLVALKANIPAKPVDEPVKILAGALAPPIEDFEGVEDEFDDAPDDVAILEGN